MSNRTFFWSRCLVLILAGIWTTGSVDAAGSTLRWKSPKIDNSPAPQRTTDNPIQQVRFDRQQTTPGAIADIDTNFPDSRPTFGFTPDVSTPAVPSQGGWSVDADRLSSFSDDLYGGAPGVGLRDPIRENKLEIRCPPVENILKPISGIGYDIRLKPGEIIPEECPLGGDDYFPIRDFNQICFMWKASALCHKPLYFEEVALERYGHTLVREEFQPIISGAKFFLTVPLLPYKMGLNPPNECIYTLGHYRPGDCAPYMIDPLPLSVRAGLIQAGVIVGGVAIFP